MTTANWLSQLDTPYLLIDEARLKRNIAYLQQRITQQGSRLRPHLKTLRTLAAADYLLTDKHSPATVSTLAEAEAYAAAGYQDLLYAVGIAPAKLERVAKLRSAGIDLHILLDHPSQVQAVLDYSAAQQQDFSVFIEIDSDNHRGGINADDPSLITLASQLGKHFRGLMTHAGGSYGCTNPAQLRAFAEQECDAVRQAKQRLIAAGINCPITSVGSTPTAHFGESFDDIDEVRAGVYTTFDLVMKNIGVCDFDDIAMSVVTTVIGHNTDKQQLLTDSGWMAVSRDRGTAEQMQDFKYGQVCQLSGAVIPELLLTSTSQEHGIMQLATTQKLSDYPIGSQLRVLPNHACATAAMHQRYQVLLADGSRTSWQRILGW